MAPGRTKTPAYDSRNPDQESWAEGLERIAQATGLSVRQLLRLIKAGRLDFVERTPTGPGGKFKRKTVVQSGTAFGEVHREEARQAHIAVLRSSAEKADRRTADLRRVLEASTILGDGGGGDPSALNVTFGTVPTDPRPGPSDKAITFQVSGCSFNRQAAATAAHGGARDRASGPGAAPGRRSVGKGNQ